MVRFRFAFEELNRCESKRKSTTRAGPVVPVVDCCLQGNVPSRRAYNSKGATKLVIVSSKPFVACFFFLAFKEEGAEHCSYMPRYPEGQLEETGRHVVPTANQMRTWRPPRTRSASSPELIVSIYPHASPQPPTISACLSGATTGYTPMCSFCLLGTTPTTQC